MKKRIELQFDNRVNLVTYLWEPVVKAKAVIIIVHGMAEHVLRYEDLAKYFVNKGFIVVGYDHYGHGESAIDKIGVISDYDFLDAIIKGLKLVYDEMKEKYDLPFYLFAHSMGAIAAQRYLQLHSVDFEKVILSGSDVGSFKYRFDNALTYLIMKIKGQNHYSQLAHKLSIEKFAKQFKSDHPTLGWLTSDLTEIRKYEENQYCGSKYPINYFYSITKSLIASCKNKNLKRLNHNLKILVISGENDPVSKYGKSTKKLNRLYTKRKIDSSMIIYQNARHECHHEQSQIKQQVYQDYFQFFNS